MKDKMVREVFWALHRVIAADLCPDTEFRSHQAACELSNRDRSERLDPDVAPHVMGGKGSATRARLG